MNRLYTTIGVCILIFGCITSTDAQREVSYRIEKHVRKNNRSVVWVAPPDSPLRRNSKLNYHRRRQNRMAREYPKDTLAQLSPREQNRKLTTKPVHIQGTTIKAAPVADWKRHGKPWAHRVRKKRLNQ